MQIRFWGVRGSTASPITHDAVEDKIRKILELATPADILTPETVENFIENLPFSLKGTYGGNTTSLEIRTGSENEHIILIDAGTGIRPLGNSLLAQGRMKGNDELSLLFTHSHWDHVQGLMFFVPIFIPGNTIHFYSSFSDMEKRLQYQQPSTHFPVPFDDSVMAATKKFQHFPEGEEIQLHDLTVSSKAVRHPGGCYAYKFLDEQGKTFIFSSDTEFNLDTMDDIEIYIEFYRDADVLVLDTQYTFEESLQKIDWGHSSAAIATDIAIKSNVKKLILFHHDPSYDDNKMDAVTLQALKYKDMMAPDHPLEIQTAYEGLEFEL